MGKRSRDRRAVAPGPHQPLVHWWGDQLAAHSLAYVNRELCRRLVDRPSLRLVLLGERGEASPDAAVDATLEHLRVRMRSQPGRHPDVTVRHHWPPNLDAPAGSGPLVVCQPWEFGALPADWVQPFTDVVDEVWCNSTYVRDLYDRSGVPAEKLVLLPHGVDSDRFRPDGPTLDLPTSKSVKLLFVGGTIHRKGIDVLLDSYVKAFRAGDDVALVVKGSQSNGAYLGSSIANELERIRATDPNAPEIVYLDADLAHDDIAALYRSCDALVHPYRGEGFGLPVAEAMATGLPVVVTEGGATRDFCAEDRALLIPSTTVPVVDRGNLPPPCALGYFVEEPDGEALVELLRDVVAGSTSIRQRAEAGRAWVTEHLRWDRTAAIAEQRLLELAGRAPVRRSSATRHRSASRRAGVNVVGFFTGGFGIAEAARSLVDSLEQAGIPVATGTVRVSDRPEPVPFTDRGDGSLPYDTTVWAVQPDVLDRVRAVTTDAPAGTRQIGYWFWESERPSDAMVAAARQLDEVWVGSAFARTAVANATTRPVRVVAPTVAARAAAADGRGMRERLGIAPETFVFLFEFDHLSLAERKNPEGVLDAFESAFAPGDGPVLVLKATHGDKNPGGHRALLERANARPDILLIEAELDEADHGALIAACDCYVSLHRAEGFGLPLAQAMAAGKATIATGWSGNLDFMDPEVSILVPATLAPAPPLPFVPAGTLWAQPDVAEATAAMRRLAGDPSAATELGRRAATHITTHHGPGSRTGVLRQALAPRSGAAPLLSACMIVKDEEAMLPACLASLEGLVDEIVVYDTGSTDRTVELARAAGARVVEGYWDDDFGRARNAALAECRGTWILHVDADETLDCVAADVRATLASKSLPDVVLLTIDNLSDDGSVGTRHKAARLFRRTRAHWLGRLHEQIVARPGEPALTRCHTDGAVIKHHGYVSEVSAAKGKAERNVRLAQADLDAAPHGERPLLLLNLARSLAFAGDLEGALARCDEGRRERGSARPAVVVSLLHFGIELLFSLGRPQDALEWVEELRTLSVAPRLADFLAGTAKLLLGQPAPELADLADVEELWDDSGLAVSGDLLRHRTALALAAAERWDETYPALLDVAGRLPNLPLWVPLARAGHAVGADPGAAAALVAEDGLRSVLAQLLLVGPEAADALAEAIWSRWPGDPRVVGFAVHHGSRLETSRALEWSARVRSAGLARHCPLVGRAGRSDVDAMERLRAVAVAAGGFGDDRAPTLLPAIAAALRNDELQAALVELDELAPDLLGPFVQTALDRPDRCTAMHEALASLGVVATQ